MKLPAHAQVLRLTPDQIAEAKARLSIVEIAERAGAVWDKSKSRPGSGDWWCCCLFHDEKSASLHIAERGAASFFKCFGCGERGDALKLGTKALGVSLPRLVRDSGALSASPDPALVEAREQRRREHEAATQRERAAKRAAAFEIWSAALPGLQGTPAERYVREVRAIGAPLAGAALRWHPRAPLSPYEPAKAGRCGAIVAAITNAAGEVIGSHLTFLKPDGSAKQCFEHLGGDARMVAGDHVGGFIKLGRVRDAVVVGEGWETTLSASEACGLPGLAAINAPNLRAVILPPAARRVVIAFDRDPKGIGELSADVLAQKLWAESRDVEIFAPPAGFKDWNDAAKAGALRAEVAA